MLGSTELACMDQQLNPFHRQCFCFLFKSTHVYTWEGSQLHTQQMQKGLVASSWIGNLCWHSLFAHNPPTRRSAFPHSFVVAIDCKRRVLKERVSRRLFLQWSSLNFLRSVSFMIKESRFWNVPHGKHFCMKFICVHESMRNGFVDPINVSSPKSFSSSVNLRT